MIISLKLTKSNLQDNIVTNTSTKEKKGDLRQCVQTHAIQLQVNKRNRPSKIKFIGRMNRIETITFVFRIKAVNRK